jgi:hypothetical protein
MMNCSMSASVMPEGMFELRFLTSAGVVYVPAIMLYDLV